MCHERYARRRREETESHRIWEEFDRTTPISEPAPQDVDEREADDPERAEQSITSER
jgi:hypothetical protein